VSSFGIGDGSATESRTHRSGVLLASVDPVQGDGASLLCSTMADLARALQELLPQYSGVFTATVHGQSSIRTVLQQIKSQGIDDLTVVPLHPQFSHGTTGAIMRELYRSLCDTGLDINLKTLTSWYDDVGYVNAQARMLAEYATSQILLPNDTRLVFMAGAPDVGDADSGTYVHQVRQTADFVAARVGWPTDRYTVWFGDWPRAGAVPQPDLHEDLERLFASRMARVLVCYITSPVACRGAHVHASARYDISSASSDRVAVCPALNNHGAFVTALKNLILQGTRPVVRGQVTPKPLLQALSEPEVIDIGPESLVMIGASLSNGLMPRFGPQLRHSEATAFRSVKKSRKELLEFLEWVKEQTTAIEAFVWDTCQRIEFYGWLRDPDDVAGRECLIARIRHQLYGKEPSTLKVNVLFGDDAWHHLMRTVSGLNSALPGDTDVAEQLRTALRIAERAGTADSRSARLVERAVEVSQRVRSETSWGRFSTGYCFAALSRVDEVSGLRLDECRHVIIGGSTTSRSVVATLSEHFRVPQRQMTLVYRCNHGQMKLLRAAIGNGKRIRVNAYSEQAVVREIADADFVYFGIDHPEPVIDAEALRGLRDYAARPLQIVDFNSFGSLSNAGPIDGVSVWMASDLDQAVTAHAEITRARGNFAQALDEAEEWILNQVSAARSAHGGTPGGDVRARSAS
jgi:glutamyl-tRNA reductase/protoheme ferro-lyase